MRGVVHAFDHAEINEPVIQSAFNKARVAADEAYFHLRVEFVEAGDNASDDVLRDGGGGPDA